MAGPRALWLTLRNRLLSDARFQRFSADFPLTRPIAHRRAEGLFDVLAGFVYSQVLSVCVRLSLFERLRAGPRNLETLCADLQLPARSLGALLEAAAALDLVERVGSSYALGPQGAALLGNPGLGEMIVHQAALWDDLGDSLKLLEQGKGEALPRFWAYASATDRARTDSYSQLMTATQPGVAADILDAYSLRRHRVVMDVGGGAGAFLRAVHARWPRLSLRVFDLPSVVQRVREPGVPADCIAGDFFADPLPEGADLITFVRILHDHDDARVAQLLRAACAALAPGGRVLIAEPMVGAGRFAGAYLSMYLLAMGSGRPRRPDDLKRMLAEAGFRRPRMLHTRTPALLRILAADKGK